MGAIDTNKGTMVTIQIFVLLERAAILHISSPFGQSLWLVANVAYKNQNELPHNYFDFQGSSIFVWEGHIPFSKTD